MKKNASLVGLGGTALLLLALNAGASSAQDTSSADETDETLELPPIVVVGEDNREGYAAFEDETAAKTSLPLVETPQSISVVTEEQIRDRPVRSVQDAIQFAPGVNGATFGNNIRNDFFQIRGFASEQQSFFADGLQLPSFAFATWRLEPYTLSSIDILRGPSSSLYGESAPGGLVNANTKRPLPSVFREAFTEVDEFGHVRAGIDVNQGADDVSVRFVGTGRRGDTEVDFTDDDGFAFAPSMLWTPSDQTSFEAYANVVVDRTNGQNFLPYEGTEVAAPYGRIERDLFTSEPDFDKFDRDQWFAGYRLNHEFEGGLALDHKLRYGEVEVDYATLFGVGYVAPPTEDAAELSRFTFATNPEATLFNVDTNVSYDVTTGPVQHVPVAGIEYQRYNIDDEQAFALGDPLDLLDPVFTGAVEPDAPSNLDETTLSQVGLYLQDTARYGRLRVLATGRIDLVDLDVKSPLTDDYSSNETALSGRLGALYAFDNGVSPYASISRSFAPRIGRDSVTADPFEPETGLQYEAGVKWQIPGWNALASVAAFHLTRDDVPIADAAFITRQVGEIRSQGIELELAADPLPGLSLAAAASFADVEVTEGPELDEGNVPTNTPETLASARADYTFESGPLRNFGGLAGIRYIGRSFADTANDLEVSDTIVVDAGLHYDLFGNDGVSSTEGASIALTATNLFDEEYVAGCNSATSCFYGSGRRVVVSLSLRW
ncbi:MAG: TonB-dependent siderophore receptor [Pseudomonadota bacterium]